MGNSEEHPANPAESVDGYFYFLHRLVEIK
jgi:hypothetical protein